MRVRTPALSLLVLLNACVLPPNVVVLIPDEAGTVGQVSVEHNNQQDKLSRPYTAADTDPNQPAGNVFATSETTVNSVFAGALANTPRKPLNFVIYFLNGQTIIDPRSADTQTAAIKAALATPFADISVIGHSDAVGEDSANLVLSMYRARAIRTALEGGGVSSTIIEVGYFGSNDPRVPRPRGVPEPENRRVEVTIR
jgi:outer membrane protein OmpA-like peptidoglycan-associated protein